MSSTMPRLVTLLAVDGWKDATEPWTSGNCYLSKDKKLHLCINNGWELERLTEANNGGDSDGQAIGSSYKTIDEGEHLHEIMEAIRCAELGTEREVTLMGAPAVKAL